MKLTRRNFLCCAAAAAAMTGRAHAGESFIEIDWKDLVPGAGGTTMDALRQQGVVQHGELSTPFDQEKGASVTTKYNGKRVRLPGYLVPLEYEGLVIKSALLVPYVGACIHVPPPPPNQLVFITTETHYESESMFEPVYVTGTFSTAATATQLAEIGYALVADDIQPYG